MARRHHYKAKSKEAPEMDVTTFLNLMVVLVPFLLASAVFSRITILELNLPMAAAANSAVKPQVTIEVIVRKSKLQIGNGKGIIASFPKVGNKYDVERLGRYLLKIKGNYPDKTDATILLEPDIEYETMVLMMDAVRSLELKPKTVEQTTPETPETLETPETPKKPVMIADIQRIELFPDMSIGDAP
jgi:biopolymer transport protein ExbD